MAVFKTGKTKLTGLISNVDGGFPLNNCIWIGNSVVNLKICWAKLILSAAAVSFEAGDGFDTFDFEAGGIVTGHYTSQFDAVPASFGTVVCASKDVDSRGFCMIEDGSSYHRVVGKQTFYVLDKDLAINAGDSTIFVMSVGVDANTTNITDDSDQTPLDEDSLNRIIAVGNYKNPEILSDTVPMLSVGYTSTGAAAGDTLVNIANLTNHSRGGAGSYTTDFTDKYMVTPLGALVGVLGDAGGPGTGYGYSVPGVDTVTVGITSGGDVTPVDRNFCFMVIGMAGAA